MPVASSSAPNDFSSDFMKYRGPTSNTNVGSSYPSYGEFDFGGKSAFEPSNYTSNNLEQPSSWLHGNDFNSMAGDLFSTKENSFGNLSLNLDQIKIVN